MAEDEERDRQLPSTDQPLHGPRRRTMGPLLLIVVILGALVLLYVAALAFLVE